MVKKKKIAKKKVIRKRDNKKKFSIKKNIQKVKEKKIGEKNIKKRIKGKYYFDISFSFKNGIPLIYEFLISDFPKFCKRKKIKELDLHINRLEPLDSGYTNISLETGALKEVLGKFAKSHRLQLTNEAGKNRVDLHAKISPESLSKILLDYNKLFDIFFTDTRIEGRGIGLDVMDFILNSALVYGDLDNLLSLQRELMIEGKISKIKDVSKAEIQSFS